MSDRDVVFISHANPEDNAFVIWLGAKLAALGYDVWADVLRLTGGEDWQRILEHAIRNRACKVLFVANEISAGKQGVRNELQIASDTAKKIDDKAFIIPLKLRAFEAPFLVAQAQYIDFEHGWTAGLSELVEALHEPYKVPHKTGNTEVWLNLQTMNGRRLVDTEERLVSTWLEVRRVPAYVYFYRNPTPTLMKYPNVAYKDGILTCTDESVRGRRRLRTSILLKEGWRAVGLGMEDARNRFTDIVNQGLVRVFESRGLKNHEMAGRQIAWWVDDAGPHGKVAFKWPEFAGRRQIQGISTKRKVRWHYGISASFRSSPLRHIRLKSRLIFTQEGRVPLESVARAHRLRRSFAKGWRNARWRDMLLSFLYWFSEGTTVFDIPLAPEEAIVISLPPMIFSCPIGVLDPGDKPDDEDDPDVDFPDDEEQEENEKDEEQ